MRSKHKIFLEENIPKLGPQDSHRILTKNELIVKKKITKHMKKYSTIYENEQKHHSFKPLSL